MYDNLTGTAAFFVLLLLQGTRELGPCLSRALVAPHSPQNLCEWKVHYDTWEDHFDKHPVYQKLGASGNHCMEVCCSDPRCLAIEMQSHGENQCYEFRSLPPGVATRNTWSYYGNGAWLKSRPVRWSIFVKASVATAPAALPAAPPVPPLPLIAHGPSVLVPPREGTGKQCDWTVYYDMWVPTWNRGEYQPTRLGKNTCLQTCCEDPTCQGLALESVMKYQCYKYSTTPSGLHSSKGRPLGDGQWLRDKAIKWSVFVKSVHPVSNLADPASRNGAKPRIHFTADGRPVVQAPEAEMSSATRRLEQPTTVASGSGVHTVSNEASPIYMALNGNCPHAVSLGHARTRSLAACKATCDADALCVGVSFSQYYADSTTTSDCYKESKLCAPGEAVHDGLNTAWGWTSYLKVNAELPASQGRWESWSRALLPLSHVAVAVAVVIIVFNFMKSYMENVFGNSAERQKLFSFQRRSDPCVDGEELKPVIRSIQIG